VSAVVSGRRTVSIHDAASWVFNRMAHLYDGRPPYPEALVTALAELSERTGPRVLDLGAGVGHLALRLAARGLDVAAVEPAIAMLERLERAAVVGGHRVRAIHAAAEALPLPDHGIDVALVADALHFIDADLLPVELRRVLAPRRSGVAIVLCEYANTPFMNGVVAAMEASAPRRPRDMNQAALQIFSAARVPIEGEAVFTDETPVDLDALERLVKTISFIGPAMNAEIFAAFRERLHAVPGPRVWARRFRLLQGVRR
jgi:SAM-dependent methyltransferase